MKTIGIDARFWVEAGPGRYTKALVEHLQKIDTENNYVVFLREKGFSQFNPQNPNFRKVLANYKWYSWEEQILFLWQILKYKLDLFYVPHFNIPVLYPRKIVTAIPDIIMHSFSTNRATTHTSLKFLIKKLAYHLVFLTAVARSKKIIVPTETVKKSFLAFYPFLKEKKLIVATEGIDPDFTKDTSVDYEKEVLAKYGINKQFLLFVGSMYRHKNIKKLIDAFVILKNEYRYDGQLVLVGKRDYFSEEIEGYVKQMCQTQTERIDSRNNDIATRVGIKSNDIILPGLKSYVEDSEIIALRKNAELYIFPSLQEGFSLTPLEGMTWGLPAVISDIPCHKEVYGDSAEYFDPNDAGDIAKTVNKVLSDHELRERLQKKGYERVKMYNWESTAKITEEIFETVLQTY